MEIVNDTHQQASTFFTAHPEPFHIFWFALIFIANFFICRYLSIQLVKAGFVAKHNTLIVVGKNGKMKRVIDTKHTSEEYKKLFLFWFIPVVGAAGLMALYITCAVAKTLVAIKQKLFLNHI